MLIVSFYSKTVDYGFSRMLPPRLFKPDVSTQTDPSANNIISREEKVREKVGIYFSPREEYTKEKVGEDTSPTEE